MPSKSVMPSNTVRIKFKADTPVDINIVPRCDCGRLQLRPLKAGEGVDPEDVGRMQHYFPADTVIELPDFVTSGLAEIVE